MDTEEFRRNRSISGLSSNGTNFLGTLLTLRQLLFSKNDSTYRGNTNNFYTICKQDRFVEAICGLWICKSLIKSKAIKDVMPQTKEFQNLERNGAAIMLYLFRSKTNPFKFSRFKYDDTQYIITLIPLTTNNFFYCRICINLSPICSTSSKFYEKQIHPLQLVSNPKETFTRSYILHAQLYSNREQ